MADQSPEAVEKRRKAVRKVLAISALEGYEPSSADHEGFERIIQGEITPAEAIAIRNEEIRNRQRASAHAA